MKSWMWKLLIVMGILLSISSARGIAADLSQVSTSWLDSSKAQETSLQQSLVRVEQSIAIPLAPMSATRSRSISPAFLDSANGEAVILQPTSNPQPDSSPASAESPNKPRLLPGAFSKSTVQLPSMELERIPGDPTRIVIPAIHLDAPVVLSPVKTVSLAGKEFQQWAAPDEFAAGWQEGSARLGETGNIVINGHHNEYGEVFRYLVDLQPGDTIQMYAEDRLYIYTITNKMILPEKYQDIDVRMDNARWIMPSTDERLTLITCWPYETNTHRLIIVALPDLTQ